MIHGGAPSEVPVDPNALAIRDMALDYLDLLEDAYAGDGELPEGHWIRRDRAALRECDRT